MELIEKINVYNDKIVKSYYINGASVSAEDYGDALEACDGDEGEGCGYDCDCCDDYPDHVEELIKDCIEDISNPEGICEDCLKSNLRNLYNEGYKEGSIDTRLGLIGQLSDEIEEFEED